MSICHGAPQGSSNTLAISGPAQAGFDIVAPCNEPSGGRLLPVDTLLAPTTPPLGSGHLGLRMFLHAIGPAICAEPDLEPVEPPPTVVDAALVLAATGVGWVPVLAVVDLAARLVL